MNIQDKIRKLLAHEESAREIGNLAEAEAFATKVQKLLIEYKLTMTDVEMEADPLGRELGSPEKAKRVAETWAAKLAVAIAGACFCTVVTMSGTNSLIFFGRDSDRAIAISMWKHLYGLALQFAAHDVKLIRVARPRMKPLTIRDRYLNGFAHAIALRLRREQQQEYAKAGETGLVRLDLAKEQVRNFQSEQVKTRALKVAPTKDSLAFRTGFRRGVDAPLRKQHQLGGAA